MHQNIEKIAEIDSGEDAYGLEDDKEAAERAEQEMLDRLTALSDSLKSKRKEAIDARIQLGIDAQWTEDTEFYEGIDDANRHEKTGGNGAFTSKPVGQTLSGGVGKDEDPESTVFINITRPYCDAAAARTGDMLMPTDDRAFAIKPTPVPHLEGIAKGKLSTQMSQAIGEASGGNPEKQASIVSQAIELAKKTMDEATDRAGLAQSRIDDWLIECQYHAEARMVIDDCARIGTGVIKGPVPVRRSCQKVSNANGVFSMVISSELKPASRRIDPRNLYPDPSCGDNIHNGSFIWEKDRITRKQLRELKGGGYIDSQIDECLKEGPQVAAHPVPEEDRGNRDASNKDSFEIWYFHGSIDAEDMEVIGCGCDDEEASDVEGVDAVAKPDVFDVVLTMVNDRVIKGALNPLDTGEFPYDVMCWQRINGRWAGEGVARQIRTPQRIVNSAGRHMMDNAGLIAGPQILMKLGVITPADGDYGMYPRKKWYIAEDADVNDIKQAFGVFNIDARQDELMAILQFGLKLAEDVTGLPMILQGQQGTAPDTLGGMQMLNNNSSTVMRRIAKGFDDYITEPHIRRYYVWLMQYGEDSEKGDCTIDARGSSALVERDLQNQSILQMGSLVMQPAFGVDPKKWFGELCKSQRLDPKSFQYSEEEQKAIQENASQGPSDPRIAVAQLNAQLNERIETMRAQSKQQILALEHQFEQAENALDRQLQALIKQAELNGSKSISLDSIKAGLSTTAIKARLQRELSYQKSPGQAMNPPAEPTGTAMPGRAYQD